MSNKKDMGDYGPGDAEGDGFGAYRSAQEEAEGSAGFKAELGGEPETQTANLPPKEEDADVLGYDFPEVPAPTKVLTAFVVFVPAEDDPERRFTAGHPVADGDVTKALDLVLERPARRDDFARYAQEIVWDVLRIMQTEEQVNTQMQIGAQMAARAQEQARTQQIMQNIDLQDIMKRSGK